MRTYLADLTLPGSTDVIKDPPGFNPHFTNIASVINEAMPLIFAIAGLILLAYLVWGGFDFLTAMGDPEKAKAGKARITNAVIGFVLIFLAWTLTQVLKFMFNIT